MLVAAGLAIKNDRGHAARPSERLLELVDLGNRTK
jgi:hypothetical protein